MTFAIAGLGTALPPHRIGQEAAAALATDLCCATEQQERILARLYQAAGVKQRHSVLLQHSPTDSAVDQDFYPPARGHWDRGPTTAERMESYDEHAGGLAALAARRALQASGWAPQAITHLITVSCSGFAAPGVDVQLIRTLELNRSLARLHVGFMGCHGAMNGLRVADEISRASADSRILLVATELCSLHQQYGWQPERLVSNALFADGAAAVVGAAPAESSQAWQIRHVGSTVLPDTEGMMRWRIGDHGFEMYLSPQVPQLIKSVVSSWVVEWLAAQGLALADVGSWAIHPGGPRILDACAQGLQLSGSALSESTAVLHEYGNMSSPTILFVIDRLRAQGAQLPCVTLGFGPGLAVEAIVWGAGDGGATGGLRK